MSKTRPSEQTETVEEILTQLQEGSADDTVNQLMELYESVERSYRAAMMAGEPASHVAYSTNH